MERTHLMWTENLRNLHFNSIIYAFLCKLYVDVDVKLHFYRILAINVSYRATASNLKYEKRRTGIKVNIATRERTQVSFTSRSRLLQFKQKDEFSNWIIRLKMIKSTFVFVFPVDSSLPHPQPLFSHIPSHHNTPTCSHKRFIINNMIIFALIVVCRSSSSPSLQSSAYSSSLFFQHIHSNFTWMLNDNDVDVKEETSSEHRFRIWRILSTHTHASTSSSVRASTSLFDIIAHFHIPESPWDIF